jgi:hypothetical protein
MIAMDVKPGTPEWRAARLGVPSASRFDCIMTPKTRKPSNAATKYMCALLAERMLNRPVDDASSGFILRGTVLESDAVTAYEFERDQDTEEVGFCLRDDRRAGCSPDRLVGSDGLLEIKCPSAAVHVEALLGMASEDHLSQCQGQLWVTGRAWVDLMFYNPDLPAAIIRIPRDDGYIRDLETCVGVFCDRLDSALDWIRSVRGLGPQRFGNGVAHVR